MVARETTEGPGPPGTQIVRLGSRLVGDGRTCFVIAEAGVNHNGSLSLAHELVDAAAEAGADAVKFQTFQAEALVTPSAPKAGYQQRTTDVDESQLDMLRRLELSLDDHRTLQQRCRASGIQFLSTPFDEASADALEALGVPAFKISSGDLTNTPFLRRVARKGRPMLISTGMATLDEVAAAVRAVEGEGLQEIVLLQCTSAYPADPRDANLRAMATMRDAFGVPVGFSDHTPGLEVALAAVALGASVLEKHLTTDRRLPGPDHLASLEPAQFAALVRGVRTVEAALGDGRKTPADAERDVSQVARKSLVAARPLAAGERLTDAAVAIRRPGTGLAPDRRADVIGRRARVDIAAGTLLTLEMLE